MADWLNGTITGSRQWTQSLFSLRFQAPIGEFKAGQFVRIALEIDGETVARPYSLVNAPGEPALEIFFNIVPEGPLTPRLASLRQGDAIMVANKPYGLLTLDEVAAKLGISNKLVKYRYGRGKINLKRYKLSDKGDYMYEDPENPEKTA